MHASRPNHLCLSAFPCQLPPGTVAPTTKSSGGRGLHQASPFSSSPFSFPTFRQLTRNVEEFFDKLPFGAYRSSGYERFRKPALGKGHRVESESGPCS